MAIFGPLPNQANYMSSKVFNKSHSKMYFLLNLSHSIQIYANLCQILPCPLTKYGGDM